MFNTLLFCFILKEPPFVMKTGSGRYEGFSVDVLEGIAKEMNFKYDIRELDSITQNRSDVEDDWDTLIKQLMVGVREYHRQAQSDRYMSVNLIKKSKIKIVIFLSFVGKNLGNIIENS